MSGAAERYARAIFELGMESGQLPQLLAHLRSVADSYTANDDLRSVLDNPLVGERERQAILERIGARLGLGRLALNTIRLLIQRRRLRMLPEIALDLARLTDEAAGFVRATVISATPLSDGYCRRLTALLEQLTQRRIRLVQEHDPSLIGGLVARIGDNTIDGSIRGRLDDLEQQMLRS
jgi:F-type H+-transporting ATPase subunit delta